MSIDLQFPLEFIVRGTPVSLQAARAKSKEAWKQRVKAASYEALPEGHFSTEVPISVTLFYFPATEMQGDVDNIVKPILDALSKHVYNDDRQVERVWVRKIRAWPDFPICPAVGGSIGSVKWRKAITLYSYWR